MPLLNENGKILSRLNLFDLFVVAAVVTLALVVYYRLSAPHRVAPPYALEENRVVVGAELLLPAESGWICDYAAAGTMERDPRTGEPRAEVAGCTVEGSSAVISLRIHALRDGSGRLLFEGVPLLPGRALELDTETAILKGVVRRVHTEGP